MNKTSFKKQSVKRTKPQLKPVYAAILLALTTQTAQALPTGAAVVSGQASFATTGNTLTVTNTPGTIINWQGFSIGSTEITRFAQQSASSSVLNRVVSNNPSNILGTLQSNGRVFLINPNGIVFGAGATVDVAGLVASTLNLSNADFLAGRYNFTAVPGAQKLGNAGNIAAQEGGQIYLIAPDVENTGVITAPNGEILLAAGHSVDLVNTNSPNLIVNITAPAGDATNVGQLIASSGRLGLFGTVVRNSGAVSANSATMEGGKIVFKATQRVEAGGTITAQGAGGGRIEVLADMQTGTVDVTGKLDASAPVSGNGGFIETSAAHVQVADSARVTTLAANGANGTWLIDPTDFTIAASGGDITGSVLSTNLVGGNVTIFSTSGTSGTAGDVNVNDTVSWSANLLTLNALNNINVNANLDGSGSASLALEYGQSSSFGSGSNYFLNNGAKINLPQGNTFSTKQGLFGTVINYYVINNLGVAGDISTTSLQGMKNGLSGNYALGADIDATTTSGWNGGLGFEPIGNATYKFTGAFEGLGHTISNLAISRAGTNYVGLFGYAENARIRNIGIVGGSIAGTGFVGGLVGYNSANSGMASISDSYSTAIVEGVTTVGGLVGYNYGLGAGNVSIINSHATGSVSGASGVGGLVGYNRADLSSSANIGNSYATGNVSGNSEVGGLVGFNWANAGGLAGIDYSHASGNISGTANVGGLVGYNDWGGISGSHAGGGSVTVTPTASPANAGGLAGNSSGAISDSYVSNPNVVATGANGDYVGGLVGQNAGSISSTYVVGGSVSGDSSVGGLVGLNASGGNISNSYAATSVNGLAYNGGVVGYNDSFNGAIVSGTIWDTNTAGAASTGIGYDTNVLIGTNSGAAGLVTGDTMNSTALLTAGFSLTNWWMVDGNTRPFLQLEWSDKITNAHQLQLMAMNLGAKYTLANNIDMAETGTGTSMWGGAGFVPVGNSGSQFTGSFNGSVRTINNLTINRPLEDYVGLFGYLNGGNINNAALVNGSVTGYNMVGVLVGYNYGIVSNSSASGSVSGNNIVGGLVGYNYIGGSITGSSASGSVDGTSAVGGLVGYNTAYIGNSSASANVTGGGGAGGLVGQNDIIATIENSFVGSGTVDGTSAIGGLVGNIDGTIINSHYAIDNVNVNGAKNVTRYGLYSTQYTDWLNGGALTPLDIANYSLTLPGSGGSYTISDVQGMKDLLGFADNPAYSFSLAGNIDLSSVAGYNVPQLMASFNGASYTISNLSVDLPNDNLGLFGQIASGSIVSDLTLLNASVSGNSKVGALAGTNEGGFINAHVSSGNVTGTSQVGGLAGYNNGGSISNSHVDGGSVITASGDTVGGLVGFNYFGTLSGSYVTNGTITGRYSVGGLVGNNSNNVSNNHVSDSIVSGNGSVGGLVGYNSGNVSNSFVTGGSVSGSGSGNHIGGLVGYNNGAINGSHVSGGNINGINNVGGLVGSNSWGSGYESGSSITLSGAYISTSYVDGGTVVAGVGTDIGGLVGYNEGPIDRSYVSGGSVTGSSNVGGLVGYNNSGSESGGTFYYAHISNSYVSGGSVTATASISGYAGGLAGNNNGIIHTSYASNGSLSGSDAGGVVGFSSSGTINDTFWNVDTPGAGVAEGFNSGGTLTNVNGLTNADMTSMSSFVGFDLGMTWWMSDGNTRPFLQSEWSNTITNSHQLQLMAINQGANYTLANNIDMAETATGTGMWGSGGFVPVGGSPYLYPYESFTGSFNGQNFTISNLAINRPLLDYVGLIGYLNGGSVINVYLDSVSVTGGNNVGGLVGQNSGYISNSRVTGAVTGATYVGGLAGSNWSTVYGSSASVDVVGVNNAGVLVGSNWSNIGDSYVDDGSVSGSNIGGLVGTGSGLVINSHYNIDTVLVGGGSNVTRYGLYSTQYNDWFNLGALTPLDIANYSTTLPGSGGNYAIGDFAGMQDLLGFADNPSYSFTLTSAVTLPAGYNVPYLAGSFDGGIFAINGLNVDLPNSKVGLFGHVAISGAVSNVELQGAIVTGNTNVGALVGLNEGNISNTLSTNGTVTGNANVGGLVGNNYGVYTLVSSVPYWISGTISNSYVSGGSVSGQSNVGGLLGYGENGEINGGYAVGIVSVSGTSFVGGIVGSDGGEGGGLRIANSHVSNSTVTGTGSSVGGLAGQSQGAIEASDVVDTNVQGDYQVGGLVGYSFSGSTINNSHVSGGSVTGTGLNGGSVGGLVGRSWGTISNSYASNGNVLGIDYVGGLVGYNDGMVYSTGWSYGGNIDNSFVDSGSVNGAINVGGLAGYNKRLIGSSHAVGVTVTGDGNVGGLVGQNQYSISNSFVDGATVNGGGSNVGGLVGINLGGVGGNGGWGTVSFPGAPGATGNPATISNSYVSGGSITGLSNVGGLVGNNSSGAGGAWGSGTNPGSPGAGGAATIGNTYVNRGIVTATQTSGVANAGGLVGYNGGISATISNSYASNGSLSGNSAGGVVGYTQYGGISGTFWDIYTVGPGITAGIGFNPAFYGGVAGLLIGDTMNSTVLASVGFNLTNWWMSEGNTRPFLQMEWSAKITNAHQLQLMAMSPGSNYMLGSHIDLAPALVAGGMWDATKGFVPVNFNGTFDGQNFSIGNLSINRPLEGYVGLFGNVYGIDFPSEISNVNLVNANVTGQWNVGSLVGLNGANSQIINSATGNAAVNVSGNNGGALVGTNEGIVNNSFASGGTVAGAGLLGGLVGANFAAGSISGSAVDGVAINGSINSWCIGGLAGRNEGSIIGSQVTGSTVSGDKEVGGLTGLNLPLGNISNSIVINSAVNGNLNTGGLLGINDGTIVNSHYNISSVSINGANVVTIGGLYNDVPNINSVGQFDDWLADGVVNPADYATLTPTGVNSYSLNSVQGMKDMLGFADNPLYTFSLASNIDLGILPGYFVPVLAGSFDGANYTVSNLNLNLNISKVALFGELASTGSVNNVGLINANVTGENGIAALVALNSGTITNSYVANSTVTSIGTGTGSGYVGGLVAWNGGAISNTYVSGGSVSGAASFAGGLVGYNTGSISNSYVTGGNVIGTANVGGVVGFNDSFLGGSVTGTFWDNALAGGVLTNGIGNDPAVPGGTDIGATGLTAIDMMAMSNFTAAGWNIANTGGSGMVWRIYEGSTTPLLTSFLTPLTITASDAAKTYDSNAYTGGNGVAYSTTPTLTLLGTVAYGGTSQGAVNAKSYTISASGFYSDQQGYDISYVDGALTVNQKVVSLTGSKVYDGSAIFTGGTNLSVSTGVGAETLVLSGTAATLNKNVGNTDLIDSLSLGLSDDTGLASNYTLAGAGLNGMVSITPLALTGTSIAAVNTTYGTPAATGAVTFGNVIGLDDVTSSAAIDLPTYSTSGNLNAGLYTQSATGLVGADAGNYSFAGFTTLSANYDIAQLALAGASIAAVATTYGTPAAAGAVSFSDAIIGDDVTSSAAIDLPTYSTSGNLNAGSYTQTADAIGGADALNYSYTPFTSAANYSVAQFALTVGAAGVNRVYDATTGASATLNDNRFVGDVFTTGYTAANFLDKNVGTAKTVNVTGITLAGTDAVNYTYNTTAATTADITQFALTVGAAGVNRVYDATTGASATLNDNRFVGDVFTTGYTAANFLDKNVGTAKTVNVTGITLVGTDALNYTYNTTAATTADITQFALTVGAAGVNRVYDATTGASATLNDNRFVGDVFTTGYTAANFLDKNVGTAKTMNVTGITLAGTDAVNYTYNTTAATTADITPYALAGTISTGSSTYGSPLAPGVATFTNAIFGDNLGTATVVVDTAGNTSASGNLNAGNYTSIERVSALSGADATNYSFTGVTGNYNVNQAALTVTANPFTKSYNGFAYSGGNGVTYSGLVNSESSSVLGGLLTYGGNSQGAIDAGTYDIIPSGYSSSNYNINYVPGKLSIDPASLGLMSVTANNASKTYGTTLTFNGTEFVPVGLFATDKIGSVTLTSTGAVGTANAGTYDIVPSNAVFSVGKASNYNITYTNGKLTVDPAPLTVAANAQNKIYGNADPALTYVASGLLFSDTLAGGLTRAVGENAMTYAINQGTLDNPNYTITYTGNNLTINARPITVAANAISKVYGDPDPTLTYTVGGMGLASWDTNATAFTGTLSRAAGENVATGPYAIGPGSLKASPNYTYTINDFTGNILTITPATLSIYAYPTSKVLYTETDPLLTYMVDGLKFNDTTADTLNGGSLVRDPGEDVGNYPIRQGTLDLSVAGSTNYTMKYYPANFTILVPTVIDEITNAILQLGTPDTGSAQGTGSTEEEDKKNTTETGVATNNTADNGSATQSLPTCPR